MKINMQEQEITFTITLEPGEIENLAQDYTKLTTIREFTKRPVLIMEERIPIISDATFSLLAGIRNRFDQR